MAVQRVPVGSLHGIFAGGDDPDLEGRAAIRAAVRPAVRPVALLPLRPVSHGQDLHRSDGRQGRTVPQGQDGNAQAHGNQIMARMPLRKV